MPSGSEAANHLPVVEAALCAALIPKCGSQSRLYNPEQKNRPSRHRRIAKLARPGFKKQNTAVSDELSQLFANNAAWAQSVREQDPEFFQRLSQQQSPQYLWIGCSDSRVPSNQIVGLLPGEVFVHRNIANLVVHTDLNCLSVLQFAVEVLRVRHVIVCGHYGCSGVRAALQRERHGLVDNWLRHLQDVSAKHTAAIDTLTEPAERANRLGECNVVEQVVNVCNTSIVGDAWARGQPLSVHGWIYGVHDGRLRDLGMSVAGADEIPDRYAAALRNLFPSPPSASPPTPAH